MSKHPYWLAITYPELTAEPLSTRRRIPYPDRAVGRARHDERAVWRERDGVNRVRMASQQTWAQRNESYSTWQSLESMFSPRALSMVASQIECSVEASLPFYQGRPSPTQHKSHNSQPSSSLAASGTSQW